MVKDKYRVARSLGYCSGLEVQLSEQLIGQGIDAKAIFESLTISYKQPETDHKYTPDFPLLNGIIIESKGRFVTADRKKHCLIKAQHPDLDIRFVYSRSSTRISKQSKTTYAMWSQHKGFLFADKFIPQAWIDEPPNLRSIAAIALLRRKK